jgi:hypothetical protein
VIMSTSAHAPPPLASTHLECPICSNIYNTRKKFLHHLRFSTDDLHKTCRYTANEPAHSSSLLTLGILPCPLACGALFDGCTTCISQPLYAHIARGTCRARRPGTSPLRRELDGPFMLTTTRGVSAALATQAAQARMDPQSVPVNYVAVTFCSNNPDFTTTHMRTSGT